MEREGSLEVILSKPSEAPNGIQLGLLAAQEKEWFRSRLEEKTRKGKVLVSSSKPHPSAACHGPLRATAKRQHLTQPSQMDGDHARIPGLPA